MKKCIGCQKNGSRFVRGYCDECIKDAPPEVVYIPKPPEYIIVKDVVVADLEKIRLKNKKVQGLVSFPKPPKICNICGGEELPEKPFTKCKGYHVLCWEMVLEERKRTCKRCGELESKDRPFWFFGGKKSSLHEGCRKKKGKKSVSEIKAMYIFSGEANCSVHGKIPITECYFAPTGYPHCKKCHANRMKKYNAQHREHILEYMRNYHKTYKRRDKKLGIKLPALDVIQFKTLDSDI